jgi:hypothetical protein
MRTRVLLVAVILVALVAGIGWHVTAQATDLDVLKERDIELTDEMLQWIEARRLTPGVHIGEFDGLRLVLISAGEKPTAGYVVKIDGITRSEHGWVIEARTTGPAGGDMVAQVITYPYALVGIKGNVELPIRVRDAAAGRDWPTAEAGRSDVQTDSGRFAGRIDMMSIEVRVSGVPEEIDPHCFRLSDTMSARFDSFGLEEGDTFLFRYEVNEWGQKVIVEIVDKLN